MTTTAPTLERGRGHIIVHLRKKEGPPPPPYELENVYSGDLWMTRVEAASSLCRQWSRPVVERIYFGLAVFIQFIIPSLITSTVLVKVYSSTDGEGQVSPDQFFEYRAVGMGIFVGTFFIVWTPLMVWKLLGKRRIRALQREWLTVDGATAHEGFVPRWTIIKPGIFSSTMAVRVTVREGPSIVTSFHPHAALPPYINPAPEYPGPPKHGDAQDEKRFLGVSRV